MLLSDVLLVLLDEPASGWDLSGRLERDLPRLVAARPSQIYPVLHRLEAAGLVSSHDEPSRRGPPRRVHRITAAGRERVASVLSRPTRSRGTRRPDLAQLSLLDRLEDPHAAEQVLRASLADWEADLAATRHDLAALEPPPGPGAPDPRRHARLGLRLVEAELSARVQCLAAALDPPAEGQLPR